MNLKVPVTVCGAENKTAKKTTTKLYATKKYDVESKPEDQGKVRTAKGTKFPTRLQLPLTAATTTTAKLLQVTAQRQFTD